MCTRRVVVLFGRTEQRRVLDQALGHTLVLLYTAVVHREGSARQRAECYVHGVGSWSPGRLFEAVQRVAVRRVRSQHQLDSDARVWGPDASASCAEKRR